jgi:membrane dipeptidase
MEIFEKSDLNSCLFLYTLMGWHDRKKSRREKMRQKYWIIWIAVLSLGVFLVSCSSQETGEDLLARSGEIHEKVLTVDTHADTPSHMLRSDWDIGERHEPAERRSGKIDLPRMKEGGLDAEFFAAYVGQGERTPEGYIRAKERADRLIDAIQKMCEDYPELVELAVAPEDAYRLEEQGKRAAYIGMENGYPIGKDLSLVEEFFHRGVRYITLCHGGDNDICDSSTEREHPEDEGLSEFGKEVVAECNRLGIMVDVSHISDQSFFDVLQVSKAPVIASHSSVRSLCDHPRNLSDEMLKALAANDGVIQICFVSSFIKTSEPNPEREKALAALQEKYGSWREIKDQQTREKMRQEYTAIFETYPEEKATLKDLVDHIDYVVELVGIDHVGIGTDFDGGGGVEGCDDVSEMPYITEELLRRGYSEEEIQKIWGGNLMRVFRKVTDLAVH